MDYYFLDSVTWQYSQALYHAAAHLGREALFILRPATPYVCIGFHQDARQEINLDFTDQQNIPVFRREVGGGAVYLDGQQLFFQLVIHRDHPEVPVQVSHFYEKFLQPVIDTYRHFGVPAEYKPVNDIITNGRKISGTGAAQIEDMMILVGNFIQDFNYEMMSKCLRVPDEKFRDKVYKTMYENLTTFLRETGKIPGNGALADDLSKGYVALLGPMNSVPLDEALTHKADLLLEDMDSPEWLFANDHRQSDLKKVKISDGVFVVQKILKTPGGLMRASAVNQAGLLKDVHISGDFFIFPASSLERIEQLLENTPADRNSITETIQEYYKQKKIESPGVTPENFSQLLSIEENRPG